MEDNVSSVDTFAPSIFDTARELGHETVPVVEQKGIEIDEETSKILVAVPFDIASYLTKLNDIKLTEEETVKLGKLWRKPLERLLSKYENSDVAIAAIATLGIAGEKYLEYQLNESRRNSSRDAGKGQDQLRKEQTT